MADGRYLRKKKQSKNRHISATVWPIWTKFGTMKHVWPIATQFGMGTHVDPLSNTDVLKSNNDNDPLCCKSQNDVCGFRRV